MAFRVKTTTKAKRDLDDILTRLLSREAGEAGLRWFQGLHQGCPTLVARCWRQGGTNGSDRSYTPITPTNSFTESALFCRAACSSAVSLIWMICSMPFEPSLHGTPTNRPLMPYSPSR